jgi:mono/diheme cytochrome c family protein
VLDALRSALHAGSLLLLLGTTISCAYAQGDAKRGLYLAKAAGCVGCHTDANKDATAFAGGRALKTPFGTFYGPNITPHPQAGIGRWTEADFMRAMRRGERPDGANYFPAFPYPSFTRIADDDLRDLWAYLRSLPPSSRVNHPHELGFPYGWRPLVTLWKWFFFTAGPMVTDKQLTPVVSRGKYLVQALGHCGECHTPRNFLGGLKTDRFLAGGRTADNKKAPNLTPTRLKTWSDAEFKNFLLTGETPDGDAASETMDEVIRNTTSQLTPDDLQALIAYLRSVPPLPDEAKSK